MRPTVLFHYPDDKGKYLPAHSFLLIKTKQNKEFVLDVSGWQFGIPSTFFGWEDYQRFKEPEAGVYEVDLEKEVEVFRTWVAEMELTEEKTTTGRALDLRETLAAIGVSDVYSWFR
jgi:hypothetical protein